MVKKLKEKKLKDYNIYIYIFPSHCGWTQKANVNVYAIFNCKTCCLGSNVMCTEDRKMSSLPTLFTFLNFLLTKMWYILQVSYKKVTNTGP